MLNSVSFSITVRTPDARVVDVHCHTHEADKERIGAEVPAEAWTYNRGPNQLMVSIRFVDGKAVAIDTLHEYGH